jgi:hypothetical protein
LNEKERHMELNQDPEHPDFPVLLSGRHSLVVGLITLAAILTGVLVAIWL